MEITGLMVDKIWDNVAHDLLFSPSLGIKGQSSGLLTTWIKDDIKLMEHKIRSNWIWVRCATSGEHLSIVNLINIYAPHLQTKKRELWKELQ